MYKPEDRNQRSLSRISEISVIFQHVRFLLKLSTHYEFCFVFHTNGLFIYLFIVSIFLGFGRARMHENNILTFIFIAMVICTIIMLSIKNNHHVLFTFICIKSWLIFKNIFKVFINFLKSHFPKSYYQLSWFK